MKLSIRKTPKSLPWLFALTILPLALAVGCTEVKGNKGGQTATTTSGKTSGKSGKSGKTITTSGKPGAVPFGVGGKKAAGCSKCPHGKADSDCSKCPKYKAAATCAGPKCQHGNSALDCSKCTDSTAAGCSKCPHAKPGKPCVNCPHAKAGKPCDKCAKGTCEGCGAKKTCDKCPHAKAGKPCDTCPHKGTCKGCAGGKTCAGAKAPCAGALAKPGAVKGCDRPKMAAAALKSGKKVLGGVKLKKSTAQGDLLAGAALYSGKTVRIEGPIVGICKGAGCWVALRGPKGKRINLKVTDGVVDFRKLAKVGVYAVGEGVFTKTGHHGAQVKITGARIGTAVCAQ